MLADTFIQLLSFSVFTTGCASIYLLLEHRQTPDTMALAAIPALIIGTMLIQAVIALCMGLSEIFFAGIRGPSLHLACTITFWGLLELGLFFHISPTRSLLLRLQTSRPAAQAWGSGGPKSWVSVCWNGGRRCYRKNNVAWSRQKRSLRTTSPSLCLCSGGMDNSHATL
ncbi:uncharacterized protein LMH87_007574 [Akanthomyces muscarius]|uniref:Uncharacterized protein n=1 Tax=Akanthomyces muscarius TaxID=2231603 RepID=A0A9W8QMF3_AKAMU|nr:uncharacterized protein LMH87_007574 [Akanthomyces muscarius]KAJ4161540.1 hypothetical protein LMH87_007574 [Akanthomyces muscarius]